MTDFDSTATGLRQLLKSLWRALANQPLLWFLPGALAFLYLHLFIPFRTPFLWLGDSAVYVMNATRMLDGQVMYRDFFQFTLPGTEIVYFALFKWLGLRAWIPNVILLLLGLGLTWVIVVISRKAIPGRYAFLPALLFLTCVYREWLDASHHWYSTLAVTSALAVVIEKRSPRRIALAAVLCGLAVCFTQIVGIMAALGLAAFLFWERSQKGNSWRWLLRCEGNLFAVFLGTVAAFNAYFVWKAGWQRFLDCTFKFGVRYFSAEWENNLRVYMTGLPLDRTWHAFPKLAIFLFVHALLPLVYVLFLMRYRRVACARPREPWDRLMLINTVGLFLFLGVAPAPAWTRLYAVSAPALVLVVWLLMSGGRFQQALVRILAVCALVLAIIEPWAKQNHWRAYLDTPGGHVAVLVPTIYDEYRWLLARTVPSELFFEGGWAGSYAALDLRNPTPIPFVTTTDYTRPEQVQEVIDALRRDRVHYVLWSTALDLQDPRNSSGSHLGPLREYLRSHYHVVKSFADVDQVWERNP